MYGYNNYQVNPYQQQMMQGRLNQMEQQYNNQMMYQQNNNQQMIKGRPVSSYDEAKASMIDLDGSLFVFTDVANKRIYTKQILLDGSAELKVYKLSDNVDDKEKVSCEYVLRSDFEEAIDLLKDQILKLKKGEKDVSSI